MKTFSCLKGGGYVTNGDVIAASLHNLIRMTEAHKDLEFLGYLMDAAQEEAENQTG